VDDDPWDEKPAMNWIRTKAGTWRVDGTHHAPPKTAPPSKAELTAAKATAAGMPYINTAMSASNAIQSRGGGPHQPQPEEEATGSAAAVTTTSRGVAQPSLALELTKEFASLEVKQKVGAAIRALVPQSDAAGVASHDTPSTPVSATMLQSTNSPALTATVSAASVASVATEASSRIHDPSIPDQTTTSAAIATASLASVQRLRAFERFLTQLVLSSKHVGKSVGA
jgi:hypothetical protein